MQLISGTAKQDPDLAPGCSWPTSRMPQSHSKTCCFKSFKPAPGWMTVL